MSMEIRGLEEAMRRLTPAQLEVPRRRFLTRIALIVERRAKKRAPVKTGHLRRSITHRVERHNAYVGTNVYYAPFQEFGTGTRGETLSAGTRDILDSAAAMAATGVSVSVSGWGIAPTRFLRGAVADSQGAIRSEISKFGRELAEKLENG